MASLRIRPRASEWVESAVGLFIHPHRFDNDDDLWFARSAFIYTYIGMAVALTMRSFTSFFNPTAPRFPWVCLWQLPAFSVIGVFSWR